MNDAIYIDTREGRGAPFSPPPGTSDYAAWLEARYRAGLQPDGNRTLCAGVAQKIHAILQQHPDNRRDVIAFGPHAGAAAAFIERLSGGAVQVDVLAWTEITATGEER